MVVMSTEILLFSKFELDFLCACVYVIDIHMVSMGMKLLQFERVFLFYR